MRLIVVVGLLLLLLLFFIVVVVALVADRERAQRTDFLEAYKQTKKHLKVNKNLIPKIQFQFGTDADADADVDVDSDGHRDGDGAASTTQNRKEVNDDNIKSQFHQWAGKAVVRSIPSSVPLSVCLCPDGVTCRRRLHTNVQGERARQPAAQLTGKHL